MQSLPGDSVTTALARVLARPEFTERDSPALLRLLSELIAAFRQWLGSLLLGWLPQRWYPVLTWLLVGILCALAAWALFALIRALVGSPRQRQPGVPAIRKVALGREHAAQWEAAARAAAADGRFRDAATALYMAAILRLEERGVVRYHPGKTPGDYRSELRTHPESRHPFDRFVRQFLPLAFGSRPPDAAGFHALSATAAELGVNG